METEYLLIKVRIIGKFMVLCSSEIRAWFHMFWQKGTSEEGFCAFTLCQTFFSECPPSLIHVISKTFAEELSLTEY